MSDITELSSPGAAWYVAHTYTGYENKVKANLEKIIDKNEKLKELIFDCRIPVMAGEEEAGSDENGNPVRKEIEEKVFPSYVLVKMIMNDETWHIVRNIRGVTGFVGPGSKPVPLTEEEVAAIGIEVNLRELDFEIGDTVKIKSGMFMGFIGTVQEISEDKKTIKVLANMFGRETPVELESDTVERLI